MGEFRKFKKIYQKDCNGNPKFDLVKLAESGKK